jgi:high-affinity iron transporter
MLAALIIVFREVFEAGLIVGIVMAATRPIPGSRWTIAGGVLGGAGGACIAALFAGTLAAAFDGVGQELFNAAILAVAVAMLAWHNIWMVRHSQDLAAQMRAAGEAVASGASSLAGLSIVVGIAVLREGVEVVLFLYGTWISEGGAVVLAGGLIGLVLGASVCAVTYLGLVRIPSRHLFAVTSIMIAFLAAGMAAQAVVFLEQANVLTAFDTIVWDSSWLLSQKSIFGRTIHTLIGYSDQPTVMEFAVYLTTLLVILGLMKLLAPPAFAKRGTTAVV